MNAYVAFAVGVVVGVPIGIWFSSALLHARTQLTASDRDLDRFPHVHHAPPQVTSAWCPRCSRLDGSHTSACERSRLDDVVAPARTRKESFSARGNGYAGADGQDLPRRSNEAARASNFGTKERGKGDAA